MKRIFTSKRNKRNQLNDKQQLRSAAKQKNNSSGSRTSSISSTRSVLFSCGTSTGINTSTGTKNNNPILNQTTVSCSQSSTNSSTTGTGTSSTYGYHNHIDLPPTLERLQWDLSLIFDPPEIDDEENAIEQEQNNDNSNNNNTQEKEIDRLLEKQLSIMESIDDSNIDVDIDNDIDNDNYQKEYQYYSSSDRHRHYNYELEHSTSDILADLNEASSLIEDGSSSFMESCITDNLTNKSEATISIFPSIQSSDILNSKSFNMETDTNNIEIINHQRDRYNNNNNNNRYFWFPGLVSLSVLESKKEISLERAGSWGKFFIPSNQRAVRESCYRHLQLYRKHSVRSFPTATVEFKSFKVTSSLACGNLDKADQIVKQLVEAGEYDAAIVAAEELLVHLTTGTSTNNHNVIEDPLATSNVARQLAILCLAMGRNRDATKYSAMAVEILPDAENPTREHASSAAMVLVEYGLVSFGTNKIGQALKTWREATHMAIGLNGYQDKTVAVLLSYIGVLHLVSGNVNNSLRSLEESYDLQRYLLSEVGNFGSSVEITIYRLASTMGNLALACERSDQHLRAIALLDESIGLYESIVADSKDLQDIARNTMNTLVDDHEQQKKKNSSTSETFPTIKEDDEHNHHDPNVSTRSFRTEEYLLEKSLSDDKSEVDVQSTGSNRSMSLFGNFDGIPDRRIGKLLTREQSDNHDFLLLGSLCPESTPEQRVRDTVLAWFGKRVEDPRFLPNNNNEVRKFCHHDDDSIKEDIPRMIPVKKKNSISGNNENKKNQSIPVDLDEENVLDADLRLREIHKQAMIHLDNHEYDEAVALFKSALRNHIKKYGTIHHLIGRAHHNIGMIYLFAKKYDAALKSFEDAVNVRLQALGPDHPDVQCSKIKIALIHMALGELSLAHDGFWDIKKRSLNVHGLEHPQVAKINNNIGVIAYEFNDIVSAKNSFDMAHGNLQHILDVGHETGENLKIISLANAYTLCNLAFVLSKDGETEEAVRTYESALILLRTYLPSHHHIVVEVQENVNYLMGYDNDSDDCDPIRFPDYYEGDDEYSTTIDERGGWCNSKRVCRVDFF